MSIRAYFGFLSRHYRLVVIASLVVGGLFSAGNHGAADRFSHDLRIYFSADNPQLAAFEAFERRFARQDTMSLLVLAGAGEVFSPQRLAFLAELTDAAWRLPNVQRVRSLANHQYSVARGDTIQVGPLVDAARLTAERAVEIRTAALAEPLLAGALVARDGGAAVVAMELNLPASNPQAARESIDAARSLRDGLAGRAAQLGLTILIGGSAASNVTLAEGVDADMRTLIPASFLVIALGLLLLLRSLFGTVIIMTVVGRAGAPPQGW
ncbi:MAG: MMPL family transporter, partial [Gammaproteobacteria bacterium]|nr:MMPL family transporter [Gammaproteobacteria bacterium]